MSLSVVIPTLGNDILFKTLESINNSSVRPDEIIICLPNDSAISIERFKIYQNIEVLKTKTKGQVAQRAEGFLRAKHEYILQTDDDIILENNCIKELIHCSSKHDKIAVGPKIFDLNNRYHSPRLKSHNSSLYENFIFYLINGKSGYQAGKISSAGIAMGTPDDSKDYNVDWLPGSCILHKKNNLIKYNYYPYLGKAYSEDILHSMILKKNNIFLVRSAKAKCNVDLNSGINMSSVFLEFYCVLRIGLYILKTKKNIYRYIIFYIATYLLKALKFIIGKK